MIEITVYGTPGPQGSKRHLGGGRMIEMSKKVKPWRESVVWAAREAMAGRPAIVGPVAVGMAFTVRKSMSAPKKRKTWPIARPDIDKLARSTMDAIVTAGVIKDDSLVVELNLAKVFPLEDPMALDVLGVRITVRSIA